MTAVMEPSTATGQTDKFTAALAEMARRNAEFEAIRPACPDSWCNSECKDNLLFGDAVHHTSDEVEVETSADSIHTPTGSLRLHAWRYDALDEPTESGIEIDLSNAGWLFDECANFSAAQARRFAAELLRHADLIEPEHEVPAKQVRVGDFLPVDDAWLYVYGVCVDEPSNCVQIFTTVEPGEWPELDGDENPHMFAPDNPVRIRRGATQPMNHRLAGQGEQR